MNSSTSDIPGGGDHGAELWPENEPPNAATLVKLGIARFEHGDAVAAVELLRRAVAIAPQDASVWNNLAVMLEAGGRFAEAEECYGRATALRPELALPHFNRGNTLRSLGRWAEAEASFRRCLVLAPGQVDALHNLGALLKERGLWAEAEQLFRETVALAPGFVDAHVNLGSTLQALQRDEEALDCYREALRLAPGYADAAAGEVSVLDRLGRMEEAGTRVQALMAMAPENPDVITTFGNLAPGLGAEEQAIKALQELLGRAMLASKREAALFTLGKLLDRSGRYDEAFACYREANEGRARAFDARHFQDNAARVRATFSRELSDHFPRARNPSALPVFVVGMPRSGTSLVEQILASHPEVFGAGELSWVDDLTTQLSQRIGSAEPYPDCVLDLSIRTLDAAAEEYLALLRRSAPHAKRVVDKMPGNFMHLGLIARLFPGARVIHITREPLDNCLSCYFQNFTQGHEYSADLAMLGLVYREYERMMEHWRSTVKNPLLEIRYEHLVEDQEGESRRLVEFCGLDWDERCLRFHEVKRVVRTASYEQVRRPMYRDSVSRHCHYESFLGPLRAALDA